MFSVTGTLGAKLEGEFEHRGLKFSKYRLLHKLIVTGEAAGWLLAWKLWLLHKEPVTDLLSEKIKYEDSTGKFDEVSCHPSLLSSSLPSLQSPLLFLQANALDLAIMFHRVSVAKAIIKRMPLNSPQIKFKHNNRIFINCQLHQRLLITGWEKEVLTRKKELTADVLNHKCIFKDEYGDLSKKVSNQMMIPLTTQMFSQVTTMQLVAAFSSAEVIQSLIELVPNIDACDHKGRTPLLLAAKYNTVDVVNKLISNNADVRAKDQQKSTILHYAAQNTDINVVKMLFGQSSNGDATECTPLRNLQLMRDVDVDTCDAKGLTPLHYALEKKNTDILKFLLEKNPAAAWTPLPNAKKHRAVDIEKILIEKARWPSLSHP